jgi:hypothetical protein
LLRVIGAIAAIVSLLFSAGVARAANTNGNNSVSGPEVTTAGAVSVSPPVRNLPSGLSAGGDKRDRPLRLIPPRGATSGHPDTAIQSSVSGPAVATSSGLNFAGVGKGDYGFSPNSAPPDTNGAVGATQYVQWVNESFAVFNKSTGAIAAGFPKAGNTLWAGLKDSNGNPSGCAVNNDGDPVAQYDKAANRWIMTQFSVSSPRTYGYLQCVAVSTSSDATGSYYDYAFPEPNFNDYPKLGVWPDGYYLTFNMFGSNNAFLGGRTCALDRAKMLVGDPTAQQVCFQFSTADGGLLPSDLDGSNPPPAGSPNYIVEFGSNSLDLFKFHVNFTSPSSSTLTGPTNIPVAAFSAACNGGGTCIPQSGSSQQLDSLADRLMYRLAYRNFGDHESLVVNHSVTAGTSVGVRWYELRNLSGTPAVYQQGTYAPDSSYRWMGSIAMDKAGDIALGYSKSSSSMFPSIAYTGRVPTDALGTMEAENTITTGGGSQQPNLNRWGDYSAMTVDPVDDCTFWYTNEYLKSSGTFNWSTRIASFKFPGCGSTTTNDFSIGANPASVSVTPGQSGTSTVSTAVTSGSAQSVSLSASGAPSGVTATFNPTSVTAGGNSTLTLATTSSTPAGTYSITITGTGVSATHSTTVTLKVSAPVTNDFSISANPASLTVAQGSSGTSTISTGVTSGSAQTVNLSVSGVPSGASATFNSTSVTAGGSSILTINTGTAAAATYTLTITGTGASATHTTTVSLTVTAPSTGNFSLSASPTSVHEPRNNGSTTSTVTVTLSSGFTGAVALSVSGQPSGVTATLSPTSVAVSGTSTLQLITHGAQVGTFTVTVTGTSGTLTHATTVSLTTTKH